MAASVRQWNRFCYCFEQTTTKKCNWCVFARTETSKNSLRRSRSSGAGCTTNRKKWRLAYLLSELFKFVMKSVMLRTWCCSRATFIEQDADSIFQLHRRNKTCFEKQRDVMFPLQKNEWFGATLSFDYKFQMACDLWEEHHWWIGAAT